MDRLLSEQDCQRIFHEVYGKEEAEISAIRYFIQAIAAAQLAKTDKEWVEWGNEKCPDGQGKLKIECSGCWAERKKELEGKQ